MLGCRAGTCDATAPTITIAIPKTATMMIPITITKTKARMMMTAATMARIRDGDDHRTGFCARRLSRPACEYYYIDIILLSA